MVKDKQTKFCVKCLKRKAQICTGHVLKGRTKIIAGWCELCAKERDHGFFGIYLPRMGLEDWRL